MKAHISKLVLSGPWAKRLGRQKDGKGTRRTLRFEPGVTVLCGPNGSGKSTIFEALIAYSKHVAETKRRKKKASKHPQIQLVLEGTGLGLHHFDFEKNNPRTRSHFYETAGAFAFQVNSKFKSHGETNRFLNEGLITKEDHKGKLLLLDEPDQALDFEGVELLIRHLKDASRTTPQIIIAAHHPLVLLEPDFHKLELVPNYIAHVRDQMSHCSTTA